MLTPTTLFGRSDPRDSSRNGHPKKSGVASSKEGNGKRPSKAVGSVNGLVRTEIILIKRLAGRVKTTLNTLAEWIFQQPDPVCSMIVHVCDIHTPTRTHAHTQAHTNTHAHTHTHTHTHTHRSSGTRQLFQICCL